MTRDFRYYTLDALGEPVPCADVLEWADWFETADRQVASTEVGDARISTVFLGLDHNYRAVGRPILWETMVFGGLFNGEQDRYETHEQARCGHDAMVAKVSGQ